MPNQPEPKATLTTFIFIKRVGTFRIINALSSEWEDFAYPPKGFLFVGESKRLFVPYAHLEAITIEEFDNVKLATRQLQARGEPFGQVSIVLQPV